MNLTSTGLAAAAAAGSYNLAKGERYDLSKNGLTHVRVGLGWLANAFDTGHKFDLDVSVFGLNAEGKIAVHDYFVYFNIPRTSDGAIIHSGDNEDGSADGDDEFILVDLSKIRSDVVELSFIVTIHDAEARRQNFGQVKKSYICLYDETIYAAAVAELARAPAGTPNRAERARYSLEDDFSAETAVQFGSLIKRNGRWLFDAVGAGFKRGLGDFVAKYQS